MFLSMCYTCLDIPRMHPSDEARTVDSPNDLFDSSVRKVDPLCCLVDPIGVQSTFYKPLEVSSECPAWPLARGHKVPSHLNNMPIVIWPPKILSAVRVSDGSQHVLPKKAG